MRLHRMTFPALGILAFLILLVGSLPFYLGLGETYRFYLGCITLAAGAYVLSSGITAGVQLVIFQNPERRSSDVSESATDAARSSGHGKGR